jgi:hypothetical protein
LRVKKKAENLQKLASISSNERVVLFPISTTLAAAIAEKLSREKKNKRRLEIPMRGIDSKSTKE